MFTSDLTELCLELSKGYVWELEAQFTSKPITLPLEEIGIPKSSIVDLLIIKNLI